MADLTLESFAAAVEELRNLPACICPRGPIPYFDGDDRVAISLDCPRHGWAPTLTDRYEMELPAAEFWPLAIATFWFAVGDVAHLAERPPVV